MATLNAGTPVRFENGGVILIGADDILNIQEGTLKWGVKGYEPIPVTDRGVLTDVVAGNERPCEIELEVKYNSIIDTDGLLTKLMGTLASNKVANRTSGGLIFTFELTVRIFAFAGQALPYDQLVFTKCYLPDGLSYSASSGADVDKLSLKLMSHSLSPTIARVTT